MPALILISFGVPRKRAQGATGTNQGLLSSTACVRLAESLKELRVFSSYY
jgi:hypothetical protein